jgi:hypothetical protein
MQNGYKGLIAVACLLVALALTQRAQPPPVHRIAVLSVVRNDSRVVARMMTSAAPHADWFVFCDTGMELDDNATVAAIVAHASSLELGVQVTIFKLPNIVNFETARNQCLAEARRVNAALAAQLRVDFFLALDADYTFVAIDAGWRSALVNGSMHTVSVHAGTRSSFPQLVPAHDATCHYRGIAHETLICNGSSQIAHIPDEVAHILHHADSGNYIFKCARNIAALEAPSPTSIDAPVAEWERAQRLFYLAQAYNGVGRLYDAADTFARYMVRFAHVDAAHAFVAQHSLAQMWRAYDNATHLYARAIELAPWRAEPWLELAQWARQRHLYQLASYYLSVARSKPLPQHGMLINVAAYAGGWQLEEETALARYHTGHVEEARRLWRKLARASLPAHVAERIAKNIREF